MDNIPKETLAYIAGFFDGEGSIGIYRAHNGSWFLSIGIGQINPIPLLKIKELFGGRIWGQKPRHKNDRMAWIWNISGKAAEAFIKSIIEYLIVKKEEALLALAYRTMHRVPHKERGNPLSENFIMKKEMSEKMKSLKKQEWSTLPM